MTRRDWNRILIAFGVLAAAWFIGLGLTLLQQRNIKDTGERAAQGLRNDARQDRELQERTRDSAIAFAGALCVFAYVPDADERVILRDYAAGRFDPFTDVIADYPACAPVIERVERNFDRP